MWYRHAFHDEEITKELYGTAKGRADEILREKPPEEIPLRLYLFRRGKGKSPRWDEVEERHRLSCVKGCPWDGATIFPKGWTELEVNKRAHAWYKLYKAGKTKVGAGKS